MSKRSLIFVWLIMTGVSYSTRAQDSLSSSVSLNEIVISSSKIPLERKESSKPIVTIDREEIEKNSGKSLAQILNDQSGLIVNGAYSNPGKNRDIFLRGASSEYLLILLDGVPLQDPSGLGGAMDIRLLSLNNIEKIEILKGSQSTLYGSDAIAGIINIISREPGDSKISVNGSLAAGSLNTTDLSGGISGDLGFAKYIVSYSRFQTEGMSEALDEEKTGFQKDGALKNNFYSSFHINPVNGLSIKPFFTFTDFSGEYDNGAFADGNNTFESTLNTGGLTSSYTSKNLQFSMLYNYTGSDRTFNSEFGESVFVGANNNVDIFGAYDLDNFQVIGGVYYQNAQLTDELATLPNPDYTTVSPYVSLLLKNFHGLNAEAGYRLNTHSTFGNQSTYSLSTNYNLVESLKVFGSFTTGFKSPTLNQLYGRFGPNPDLKPQLSKSLEGGLSLQKQHLSAGITVFSRKIDQVIIYDFNTGYLNENQQNDYGTEVELGYKTRDMSFSLAYNYLDGAVTSVLPSGNDTTYFNLIRRPNHSFKGVATFTPVKNFNVSVQGHYLGKRSDRYFDSETFETKEVELDPYFLLNANAQYAFLENRVTLFLDLKNVLNSDYVESIGFSTIGFNFMSGIRFKF